MLNKIEVQIEPFLRGLQNPKPFGNSFFADAITRYDRNFPTAFWHLSIHLLSAEPGAIGSNPWSRLSRWCNLSGGLRS